MLTVTQNIDPLHEWAGTKNLIHMHGEILKALCAHCGAKEPWQADLSVDLVCRACNRAGGMRPAPKLARGWRAEFVGHLFDELLAGRRSIRIADATSDHPLVFE